MSSSTVKSKRFRRVHNPKYHRKMLHYRPTCDYAKGARWPCLFCVYSSVFIWYTTHRILYNVETFVFSVSLHERRMRFNCNVGLVNCCESEFELDRNVAMDSWPTDQPRSASCSPWYYAGVLINNLLGCPLQMEHSSALWKQMSEICVRCMWIIKTFDNPPPLPPRDYPVYYLIYLNE